MNTATKQTAANNAFLATIKQDWNHKIYKEASKILNQEDRVAAIAYLQQFTLAPLSYDAHRLMSSKTELVA